MEKYKSGAEQTRTSTKIGGTMEELASSADQTRNNPQTITSLIIVSNNYEKRP